MQSRLDATTTSNTLLKEELALTKVVLQKTQEENVSLRNVVKEEGKKKFPSPPLKLKNQYRNFKLGLFLGNDSCSSEVQTILSSSKRSSTYLAAEDAIAEVKLQLAEEKNRRLDLEKEFELQTSMRAETEVALKLLEKDIHEKQDTIISLRKQIEDIKIINLEMYRKLQVLYMFD